MAVAKYKVDVSVVKVSTGLAGGNRIAHLLEKGSILPEGVDEKQIASLVKRKLVVKLSAAESKELSAPAGASAGQGSNDAGQGGNADQK